MWSCISTLTLMKLNIIFAHCWIYAESLSKGYALNRNDAIILREKCKRIGPTYKIGLGIIARVWKLKTPPPTTDKFSSLLKRKAD